MREIVYEATERTRRLMFELRPQLLEAQGLRVAVGALLEEAADESGLEVSLDAPATRFPAAVEDMVYRVVREAVQNVRKHAAAHHVVVRLFEAGRRRARHASPTTAAASTRRACATGRGRTCTSGWTRSPSGCGWPAASSRSTPSRAGAPR